MLGELTEEEQHRYQQRLLDDDALFREVDGIAECIQDELAEDYVSGNLGADQRLAFERSLVQCDSIQQKVVLHKALRAFARRNQDQPSWRERIRVWFQPILLVHYLPWQLHWRLL